MGSDDGAGVRLDQVLAEFRSGPGFAGIGRVLVAMSGGIDSSVAAALLHRAGVEVVGVSMRLFQKNNPQASVDSEGRCCSLEDFQDARKVSQDLGFPHFVLDFQDRFRDEVILPFTRTYLEGMTPSPCINCNKSLKFDALLERAQGLAASHVATGHYARVQRTPDGFALLAGIDPVKDQSYFLYHLNQKNMNKILFPLGGFTKGEIRELGRQLGLHLAEKAESQEICFITEGRYDRFLREAGAVGADRPGVIRALDGTPVGQHQGYWKFTVGQRRGLGVAAAEPLYVVRVAAESNTVWVGTAADLRCPALVAEEVNWCRSVPTRPFPCAAKIRSRSGPADALVVPLEGQRAAVTFLEPQRAVAPGQAVVFYHDQEVVGGGWIAADRP